VSQSDFLTIILSSILQNVVDKGWRDKGGVNGPLMRVAFPSAAIERTNFWEDLIYIDQTFVFEKAMVVSRVAAHKKCVPLLPINLTTEQCPNLIRLVRYPPYGPR